MCHRLTAEIDEEMDAAWRDIDRLRQFEPASVSDEELLEHRIRQRWELFYLKTEGLKRQRDAVVKHICRVHAMSPMILRLDERDLVRDLEPAAGLTE